MGASFKSVDDRQRQATKIAERCREIVTKNRSSFIERYVQADVNLAIRRRCVGRYKNGFILKALPLSIGELRTSETDQTYATRENEGSQKAAVFPGQIEIMEGTKHGIPVCTGIWPEVFDDSLVCLIKPLYLFEDFTGWISPIGSSFPDRKIGTFAISESVACRQDAGQQIEAAPYAVNNNTGLGVDNGGGRI